MFNSFRKTVLSKLRVKIIGGYLLILILMNLVGWIAFLQFRFLNKEIKHLTQDVAKEVRISDQVVFQTLSMRSSVDSYLAFQKEEDDLQAEEHIKNLRMLLHDAGKEISEANTNVDLKQIEILINEYAQKYKNAVLRLQSRNENVIQLKSDGVSATKRTVQFAKSVMDIKEAAPQSVDLLHRISEIQEKVDVFLFTHETDARDKVFSDFQKAFDVQIPALVSLIGTQKDKSLKPALDILSETLEDYQDTFSGLSSIILKLDSEIKMTLTPYAPKIVSIANRIAKRGWDAMDRARVDVDARAYSTAVIIIGLCLFATLIGFLTGMLISGRISKPIKHLEATASKLAAGDLSLPVRVSSTGEVGVLEASFEKMRVSLKDLIENLESKVEERTTELHLANEAILKSNQELQKAKEELSSFNQELERKVQEQVSVLQKSELLKRYLAPQLVDKILEGQKEVKIQHERRKLTIFFSDIQGFTQTTDSMEAEELSELLNEYLSAMSQIAFEYGGTIDKFIGDAIMIFFGAPEVTPHQDNAKRCVLMALAMREKMKALRKKWIDQGYEFPLEIRMGINTGYAAVGNYGSESRMDYTAIGGQVNLASRLESISKVGEITISHSTSALIKDIVECECVGTINVKGIFHPVMTYKVLHLKDKKTGENDFPDCQVQGSQLKDQG